MLEILPDPKVKEYCLDPTRRSRPWAGDLLILGQDTVEQTKLIQTWAGGHWGEFLFLARKLHLFYQGAFRFLSSLTRLTLRLGVFSRNKVASMVCMHLFVCSHGDVLVWSLTTVGRMSYYYLPIISGVAKGLTPWEKREYMWDLLSSFKDIWLLCYLGTGAWILVNWRDQ